MLLIQVKRPDNDGRPIGLGAARMTLVLFQGGDMDGVVREFCLDPAAPILKFDGLGGAASPKGTYATTNETTQIDGLTAQIWMLIS